MILQESYDYYLIAPKIIIALIFFLVAWKIYDINRKYLLNKFYFAAMVSWGIYIFTDAIIWVIAPESYNSYILANILRDIQMIGSIGLAYSIYNAQKVIDKGSKNLINFRFYLETLFFIIIMVTLIIIDSVAVTDINNVLIDPKLLPINNYTNTFPVITIWTAILAAIPTILYTYAIFRQFLLAKNKIDEQALKSRIYKRSWALLFILFGIIFFIIQNIFAWYGAIPVVFGYGLWGVASGLMWLSTKKSDSKSD